jgi:hypothetical protein
VSRKICGTILRKGGAAMRRAYSEKELEALQELIQRHGHLTYCSPTKLEEEFFELTGIRRRSGPLYMAAWRLEKGYYNRVLQTA